MLGLTDVGAVAAVDWPALTAGLQRQGAPRLIVARLTGAALALGRYQRPTSTLSPRGLTAPTIRRVTGGRTIALGAGLRAIALALPHRSWLVSDQPAALPAASFLNRAVRGLITGLGSLGLQAGYFGRDFLTIDSGQAAYLSFDLDDSGHALLECILAGEAHWWPPEETLLRPPPAPSRGNPGPSQPAGLATLDGGRLLRALGQGYAARFGLETQEMDSPIERGIAPSLEDEGFHWSAPLDVAIGIVECGARVVGEEVSELAFRGDLLADSSAIAALRTPGELAPILANASHALLGATAEELAAAAADAVSRAKALLALRQKYRELVRLREERDRKAQQDHSGFSVEERARRRARMRELARDFPGALRELEDLSLPALRERQRELDEAIASGKSPQWIGAMLLFHVVLREALSLRADAKATGQFWRGREVAVRRPPSGRLLDLIWEAVGHELTLAPEEAERLVYPGVAATGSASGSC